MLPRNFEDIVEAAHIDGPGDLRLILGNCRQKRGEMIDRADIVTPHRFVKLIGPDAVDMLVGPVSRGFPFDSRQHAQVRGNYALDSVTGAERGYELAADLAECSGDKNFSHIRQGNVASSILTKDCT